MNKQAAPQLVPVRAIALPVALVRIGLGKAWTESPEHLMTLFQLNGLGAFEGYMCHESRN